MPLKKFILMKENAKFTERQKMYIDYHIGLHSNWKNFKDLISVKLKTIGDNYFDVEVEETDTKWHSAFSRELCRKADLNNLKVNTVDDAFLFTVIEL